MKITKTEIKDHIDGKDPVATYYGGLVGLGLEIYETITTPDDDYVYFVEVAGMKETPKNRKFLLTMMAEAASVGDIGLSGWTNASEPIGNLKGERYYEKRKNHPHRH